MLLLLVFVLATAGGKGVKTSLGAGTLSGPTGVTVHEATGTAYVVDRSRIFQFDADGDFVRAWGWGVADGSNAFQTCSANCRAAVAPGTAGAAGALPSPQGVVVDQATGNVYVPDQTDRRINVFGANGTFQGAFGWGVLDGGDAVQFCTTSCLQGVRGTDAGQFGDVLGFAAIDPSSRHVYIADSANRRVSEFTVTVSGGIVIGAAFERAFGWGVDTGGDAFEVCTIASTCAAGIAGSQVGQFGANQPVRVAVDSNGAVYAVETATAARRVVKFTPEAGPPAIFVPQLFADAQLRGSSSLLQTFEVAIGAGNSVFALKTFAAGTTAICPDGQPSRVESRVLELNSSGALLDTHMSCAAILSTSGLAVNIWDGRILVPSTTGTPQLYVLDDVLAPLVATEPVADVTATGATFRGTVNPNGSTTAYRFELSSDGGASWTPLARPDLALGNGTTTLPVRRVQGGLTPNTDYVMRIVATKPFGNPITSGVPQRFRTVTAPPTVAPNASTATPAGDDPTRWTATFGARVNPNGSATSYAFEYGTTTAYGVTAPATPEDIGAGNGFVAVEQPIGGLAPNTTYHYRIVASSPAGTTRGPDRMLTTGPALPDGRVYEMVSPPDKNGGDVLVDTRRNRAARNGSALTFPSLIGFADAHGGGASIDYMAVRGDTAWRTHAISPPQDPQGVDTAGLSKDPIYEGEMSPDLSTGIVTANPSATPLVPGHPNVAKVQNLYRRTDVRTSGAGSYTLLTDAWRSQDGVDLTYRPRIAGASDDFGHLVFDSTLNLVSGATGTSNKVYEWVDDGFGGNVRVVSILDDGSHAANAQAGRGFTPNAYYRPNTISDDGSRIMFTSGGQIYQRRNGSVTVRINRSERTTPEATQSAELQAVTPDGSKVFFATSERLVDADENSCVDIYRYDAALPDSHPSNLRLVTEDREPADDICPGSSFAFVGTLGISDDGSTAYLLAPRQLVAGAPSGTASNRVYRWRDGEMRYIGKLSDRTPDSDQNLNTRGFAADYTVRVTPSGSHLLFASYDGAGLTGYDHGRCLNSAERCRQLYVYDATADGGRGVLTCVSCRPDGVPATVDATFDLRLSSGGANSTARLNHPITDDGRRVFFGTADALLPQDVNGRSDVYQYDTVTGQLALISSGSAGSSDAYFLDASATGDDVFLATRDQLSKWDEDQAFDVYDARVDGGLPEPPIAANPCTGSGCQGEAPAPPFDPTPASVTFSGATDSLTPSLLPVFQSGELTRRQLRQFSQRGRTSLLVRVSEAGRVTVRVQARIGGRTRVIARASGTASGGQVLRVSVQLSRAARRTLRRTGRLRIAIVVGYSHVLERQRAVVVLRHDGGRSRGRGGRS